MGQSPKKNVFFDTFPYGDGRVGGRGSNEAFLETIGRQPSSSPASLSSLSSSSPSSSSSSSGGEGGGNEAFLETIRRQPSVKSG